MDLNSSDDEEVEAEVVPPAVVVPPAAAVPVAAQDPGSETEEEEEEEALAQEEDATEAEEDEIEVVEDALAEQDAATEEDEDEEEVIFVAESEALEQQKPEAEAAAAAEDDDETQGDGVEGEAAEEGSDTEEEEEGEELAVAEDEVDEEAAAGATEVREEEEEEEEAAVVMMAGETGEDAAQQAGAKLLRHELDLEGSPEEVAVQAAALLGADTAGLGTDAIIDRCLETMGMSVGAGTGVDAGVDAGAGVGASSGGPADMEMEPQRSAINPEELTSLILHVSAAAAAAPTRRHAPRLTASPPHRLTASPPHRLTASPPHPPHQLVVARSFPRISPKSTRRQYAPGSTTRMAASGGRSMWRLSTRSDGRWRQTARYQPPPPQCCKGAHAPRGAPHAVCGGPSAEPRRPPAAQPAGRGFPVRGLRLEVPADGHVRGLHPPVQPLRLRRDLGRAPAPLHQGGRAAARGRHAAAGAGPGPAHQRLAWEEARPQPVAGARLKGTFICERLWPLLCVQCSRTCAFAWGVTARACSSGARC